MKTGRNLQEVVQAIVAQKEASRDFLAPAKRLEMVVVGDEPQMVVKGDGYPLKQLAEAAAAAGSVSVPRARDARAPPMKGPP